MIISLRGTNGSGKSTIVREIMTLYNTKIEIQYPGRRKPTGYVLKFQDNETSVHLPLFVPGHYEIANGGVDTLPSLDLAYKLMVQHSDLGFNVLYEGKNLSDGPGRLIKLRDAGFDARAALVDESVKTCVLSVRERGHRIKRETIERLHAKSRRDADALERAGVEVYRGNRAAVLRQVREWLSL